MAIPDSDSDIIGLLRDASTRDKGFRLLLQRYGDMLYWHIRRIVVSHDDAEDAMQETAINIFSKLGDFRGDSALRTWIYRVATNEALQVLRHRCSFMQSIDSDGFRETLDSAVQAQGDMDSHSVEVLFQKALLQLPTQQRLAFNMRYYDELPYEEIAVVTGKKVSTLKTNYHFAVEKIKNYLKEHAL